MNANSADVDIVGSGIAGAIMAAELSKKGIKVTILEAGSMPNRAQAMEKYFNSVIEIPESPYDQAPHAPFPLTVGDTYFIQKGKEPFKSTYLRVAGGTTWHWLGNAIRFLPEDFKMKTNFGV